LSLSQLSEELKNTNYASVNTKGLFFSPKYSMASPIIRSSIGWIIRSEKLDNLYRAAITNCIILFKASINNILIIYLNILLKKD